MKTNQPIKVCMISITCNNHYYLREYLNMSSGDEIIKLKLDNDIVDQLKEIKPDLIILDQYFSVNNKINLIKDIRSEFNNTYLFSLSPQFAGRESIIRSVHSEKHYSSNFNSDIIKQMNQCLGTIRGVEQFKEAG